MTAPSEISQGSAPSEGARQRPGKSSVCAIVCIMIVAIGLVQGFGLYSWLPDLLPTAFPARLGVWSAVAVVLLLGAIAMFDGKLAARGFDLAFLLGLSGFFSYVAVRSWYHFFTGTQNPFATVGELTTITPFGGVLTIGGLLLLAWCIGRQLAKSLIGRVAAVTAVAIALNTMAVCIIMLVSSAAQFDWSASRPSTSAASAVTTANQ
jgi:hypothetical protein